MRRLLTPAEYAFNKSAKTLTFAPTLGLALERVLEITNLATNTVLYDNDTQASFVCQSVLTAA